MRKKIIERWNNLSISSRLYIIVSVMAVLIGGELFTLRFATNTLSAVRAFVGGEGLWTKAQKNAAFSLQRYGLTRNEEDFKMFQSFLLVPEGDHLARIELMKAHPDFSIIRKGFLQGHIHGDDIDSMTKMLRRFYWISYLAEAIEIWSHGDELLSQFKEAGVEYHRVLHEKNPNRFHANELLVNIEKINDELSGVQEAFSAVLGDGSRWLEHVVITLLIFAVMMVEGIGLTLTFFTSRYISRGLGEITAVAASIGAGNFDETVVIHSNDEIGTVGRSINQMGKILKKSYRDLEARVQERTSELAKTVTENQRLYEEARSAVQMRDEFMSIASHELKTPLTALQLQLQLLLRYFRNPAASDGPEKAIELSESGLSQTKRLNTLIDELLDLTRINSGKLQFQLVKTEITKITRDCVLALSANAAQAGSSVEVEARTPIEGQFDPTRVSQVVTNLLSNAIKYGNGKPIKISVEAVANQAVIKVTDHGRGIPADKLDQIFSRFERVSPDQKIEGLGLGLYISREIVKALGGNISVTSELDRGSTFVVELPFQK